MFYTKLNKALGLLLLLFAVLGCELGEETGVVPVGGELTQPVEGLLAIAADQHVLVMDMVTNPDKSKVRILKVFDRGGQLLASQSEQGFSQVRCADCGAIVALDGPYSAVDGERETRFLAMYENGKVWEVVCNILQGSLNTGGLRANFVQEAGARLTDFALVGRSEGRSDGATVFRSRGQDCGPLHPFLQWEPNRSARQIIDLEPWMGCEPQYLRIASDENTKKFAVLGGDKVLLFRIDRSVPSPVAVLDREVDLPARPDRVYTDLAIHGGIIGVIERTTGGEANREHSLFLFDTAGELLDQKTAQKLSALAFSTANPRSTEVPVFAWYSGLDFDSAFRVMRRQLVANLE